MSRPSYYVISVESRKGGVGKTTAALNLAKLLLEREFQVLFLDIDITGTNVTDVLNSPFWKDSAYASQYKMGSTIKNANLLEIFSRHYMSGQTVPRFVTDLPKNKTNHSPITAKLGKINVIGSQVFDDKNEKEPICEPSFLFDKLHAYWFVEFLKGLCSQFVDFTKSALKEGKHNPKSDKCVIILDNSPGYVGFAPMIQEWLTDYGPDKAKLLMVSSHDKQDLISCSNTLAHIHKNYSNKLGAAKSFLKALSPNGEKLDLEDEDMMAFITRLFETKDRPDSENELLFYHPDRRSPIDNGWIKKGTGYKEHPEKYLAILLNKVLVELFSSDWKLFFQNSAIKDDADFHIKSLLFKRGHGWGYPPELRHVVRYDDLIDFQYSYDSYRLNHRESDYTEGKLYRHQIQRLNNLKQKINDDNYVVDFSFSIAEKNISSFFHWIELAESNYLSILSIIQTVNDPVFNRMMRPEFRFESIVANVESIINTHYHLRKPTLMRRPKLYNEHRDELAASVTDRANYFYGPFENEGEKTFLQSSIAVALLSAQIIWEGHNDKELETELPNLIAFFAKVESSCWKDSMKEWRSPTEFLVKAEINIDKEEYESKDGFPIRRMFGFNFEEFGQILFDAFRKAQARLIELAEDYSFLVSILVLVLQRIGNVEHPGNHPLTRDLPFMSNLRDILSKVIIEKTIGYDQALKEISKQGSDEAKMLEFQKTLENVLTDWEVDS